MKSGSRQSSSSAATPAQREANFQAAREALRDVDKMYQELMFEGILARQAGDTEHLERITTAQRELMAERDELQNAFFVAGRGRFTEWQP